MTQFKEKSAQQRELTSAGIFLYPVLQAADVLAYGAHEVPVGDDQRQHVELMRDIALRFNTTYGETLVVPSTASRRWARGSWTSRSPRRRCRRQAAPSRAACIVDDEPDDIRRKFKRAVADSGREIVRAPEKPGISNLIEVLSVVRGSSPEEVEREFDGSGYGDFKTAVAEEVVGLLEPVRSRYLELRPDEEGLERALREGAERARAMASETLATSAE